MAVSNAPERNAGSPAPIAADGASPRGVDVELVSVSRSFGVFKAVDDISLAIRSGEFFSLLGPSGCGKTTTLRMIGGFELPSSGEVWVKGVLMGSLPPNRRPTNMVFQQLALFPHLTVFENIAFGLRLARVQESEIKRRVGDAISLVSLEGLAGRMATQLSGGQQQRVALARALVNEPAVLLLDEPFAALDLKLRSQMQGELKSIQRRLGTTFVFVTHDQGEAFGMSDRVALMNGGVIEQIGPPRELYDAPRTRFVATFVGDTNLFHAKVVSRDGPHARAEADGMAFDLNAADVGEGGTVDLSLRPERIDVGKAGAGAQFPVKVVAAVFQGPMVRLVVRTASGRDLTVVALNQGESAALGVGDDAAISWSADSLVVLRS